MDGNYQVVVVGAGAAGMMAAGRAAELGTRVLLLEKMERPGKKILITGNGRCNLSNSRDMESFISQFGPNGRFLYSAFNRFFRDELLALLKRYGVECKTEPEGKIYPKTDNARDIVRAFSRYVEDGAVTVRFGAGVTGITIKNGSVSEIQTVEGSIPVSVVVMAAGGSSHPQTGSNGDGFRIAAALGQTVTKLRPGLVPLVVTDTNRVKDILGASLRNVRVTAFQSSSEDIDLSLVPGVDVGRGIAGKHPKLPVIESRTGDAIITHFGLSGPVVLEMSLAIVDALENGPVSVSIDLVPDQDTGALRKELQQLFDRHSRQTYRNIIRNYLPQKLVAMFVAITGVSLEKLGNQITSEERERFLESLKSLTFDIKGPYSMATAMVTAGGVSLKEVDPRTMESKMVKGLYFCGEVLDLDAGTGGYNLQAAFSTGYVAGESAASQVLTEH